LLDKIAQIPRAAILDEGVGSIRRTIAAFFDLVQNRHLVVERLRVESWDDVAEGAQFAYLKFVERDVVMQRPHEVDGEADEIVGRVNRYHVRADNADERVGKRFGDAMQSGSLASLMNRLIAATLPLRSASATSRIRGSRFAHSATISHVRSVQPLAMTTMLVIRGAMLWCTRLSRRWPMLSSSL